MGTNVKYKSSVFSMLFSDPDILKELYCALDNVSLPPDVTVTINTLKDVLFMDRENDLSFEIGGKIVVLIEHQSTINLNMPLRLLIYIAHIYEIITGGKDIYAKKKIPLPTPEFFVLYNSEADYPEEGTLRLSDCFENPTDLGLPWMDAALELKVRVININEGKNAELARKCETLAGYSVFVGRERGNEKKGMKLEEAVKEAVEYCLEHDILKEFFEKNAAEVIKMLKRKWNMKDALAVSREEGREDGIEEGIEKGRGVRSEEIARNALMKGFSVDVVRDITGLDTDTIQNLRFSGNITVSSILEN
jgi:hypothetical protein